MRSVISEYMPLLFGFRKPRSEFTQSTPGPKPRAEHERFVCIGSGPMHAGSARELWGGFGRAWLCQVLGGVGRARALPSVRLLRRRLYAVDSQIQSQFRFDAPPISLIHVEYRKIKFAPNN